MLCGWVRGGGVEEDGCMRCKGSFIKLRGVVTFRMQASDPLHGLLLA